MAEAIEPEGMRETESVLGAGAVGVAVALDEAREDPSLRAEIAAFLAAQRELTELQARNLKDQVGDVRLRTASDFVKLSLQVLTLAAALALIVLLGAMVHDATGARGLVVAGVTAPPSFAARGLSGDVLAGELTSRIAAVDRFTNASSLTRSDDVRAAGGESVKLEIPETGLSLDEVARFLRRRLGHEVTLRADARDEGGGVVSIVLAVDGADPIVVRGPAADIDSLMQQAAEKSFQAFDPTNYVLYLSGRGRDDEAHLAAQELARSPNQLFAGAGFSLAANTDGDRRRALATDLLATELVPAVMAPWMEAASCSEHLGHDEAMLAYARRLLTLRPQDQPRQQQGSGIGFLRATAQRRIDLATGDFGRLAADASPLPSSVAERFAQAATFAALQHDATRAAFELGQLDTMGVGGGRPALEVRWRVAAGAGDWPAALAAAQDLIEASDRDAAAAQASVVGFVTTKRRTVYEPWLALSLSKTGDVAAAQTLIGQSPLDCYACLRIRARVSEGAGDRAGADRWFAEAVRQGPSLPYAHQEWGLVKLARGDAKAAQAELAKAQSLGPRFPDAAEGWGEALLASGDAPGAVAKFSAAANGAPKWGRLHLKWGEALAKAGHAGEARAQFRTAAGLYLSAPDRAELAAQRV
jgi:tetratricopeptide (TPR) repeat protein